MSRVGVPPFEGGPVGVLGVPPLPLIIIIPNVGLTKKTPTAVRLQDVLRPVGVIYRCVLAAPPRSLPTPTAVLSEPAFRLVGVIYRCVQ